MKKLNVRFPVLTCASLAVAVAIAASGCSMKKNMDEMHDSTVEMNQKMTAMYDLTAEMKRITQEGMDRTNAQMELMYKLTAEMKFITDNGMKLTNKQMAEMYKLTAEMKTITKDGMDRTSEQMERMYQLTAQMKAITEKGMKDTLDAMCNMYQDGRQGGAISIRTERLNAMNAAANQATKISEAGKYMMAFEFQLLKVNGCTNQIVMNAYKLQAVEEFFRDLPNLGVESESLGVDKKYVGQMGLNALAVTLHRVNPNAEALVETRKIPETSMLSIITDALKRKRAIDEGSPMTETEREVLANEDAAVYMLQLRSNFLAAMAFEKLTGISKMRGIRGTYKKLKMLKFGGAQVYLSQYNVAELKTFTTWVNEASRVRGELKKLGYDARMNGQLKQLYDRMDIYVSNPDVSDNAAAFKTRVAAEMAFADSVDKLTSW